MDFFTPEAAKWVTNLGHLGHKLGHKAMRYTIKVRNTYQYRRRVPDDLKPLIGKDWWKVSLKTGSEREAESKARTLAVEHDRLIETFRSGGDQAKLSALAKRSNELSATVGQRVSQRLKDDPDLAENLHDVIGEEIPKAAVLASLHALQMRQKVEREMFAAAVERLKALPEAERKSVERAGGIESLYQATLQERAKVGGVANLLEAINANLDPRLYRHLAPDPVDIDTLEIEKRIRSESLSNKERLLTKLAFNPRLCRKTQKPTHQLCIAIVV